MSSKPKKSVLAFLSTATEAIWAGGFALAGLLNRAQFRTWSSMGHGQILVIAPHPDDECTGCGGTIALHTRAGDRVSVLQITDGRSSRAHGLEATAMAQVRAREGRAAAAILGVACLEQLGLHERAWDEAALTAALRQKIVRIQPGVIYAPSCIEFHPEHLRVARALAAALDRTIDRPLIRIYEISVPLTPRLANFFADTSTVADLQDAALAAYPSQADSLQFTTRLRRYSARYFRVAKSAEAFWEMSPREYYKLMQRGDWLKQNQWEPALTPFRSLRPRAYGDPRAFWQGTAARRALKKIIEDEHD